MKIPGCCPRLYGESSVKYFFDGVVWSLKKVGFGQVLATGTTNIGAKEPKWPSACGAIFGEIEPKNGVNPACKFR